MQDGLLTLDATLPLLVDVGRLRGGGAAGAALGHASGLRWAALAHYGGEPCAKTATKRIGWPAPRVAARNLSGLLFALAEAQQRDGASTAALGPFQRLIAADPLHEAAHTAWLMRFYAEQGQQALAIRQYQTLRAALETHLDTEPSAAVRRLYADIVTNRLPTSRTASKQGAEPPPRERHNLPLAPPAASSAASARSMNSALCSRQATAPRA